MSRKIIIDTDPGVDDAMAIFYALNSPELEVLGLTSVFGNASGEFCAINALRLLEIAERSDLPVSQGAHRPLTRDLQGGGGMVHGEDGQGNTHLPLPEKKANGLSAAEYIVQQVMAAPGEITIVALGPLTNLALALLLQPRLAANIREIVLMGGAVFVPGNLSPAAEANIYCDPEAADTVFSADCPITMCGLDVTHKTLMTSQMLDRIGTFQNPRALHIARILPIYRGFYKSVVGADGIFVHDPTTISYLLAPQHYQGVHLPVCVDTSSGISRGKTWAGRGESIDAATPWAARRSVHILVEVNAAAVLEMELERLAQA